MTILNDIQLSIDFFSVFYSRSTCSLFELGMMWVEIKTRRTLLKENFKENCIIYYHYAKELTSKNFFFQRISVFMRGEDFVGALKLALSFYNQTARGVLGRIMSSFFDVHCRQRYCCLICYILNTIKVCMEAGKKEWKPLVVW